MPFENDPLQPSPDDKSGAQGGSLLGGDPKPPPALTPQQILEAEYEQDYTRREQIAAAQKKAAHNSSVKQLYSFIVMFSLCCTSCGLISSVGYLNATPEYSYDDAERRVHRLYLTGYDPIMADSARQEWIEKHGNPDLFEIVDVSFGGMGLIDATVIVHRDGHMDVDTVSFFDNGLLRVYIPKNSSYGRTYSFTEAAITIDSSVYPESVDEIPESFLK